MTVPPPARDGSRRPRSNREGGGGLEEGYNSSEASETASSIEEDATPESPLPERPEGPLAGGTLAGGWEGGAGWSGCVHQASKGGLQVLVYLLGLSIGLGMEAGIQADGSPN